MEVKNKKVRVFFLKLLKILMTPITRIRILMRKSNVRQINIIIGVLIILACIAIVIYQQISSTRLYLSQKQTTPKSQIGTPLKHVPLNEVYKDLGINDDKDYILNLEEEKVPGDMVNTPGCKIPVVIVDYAKDIPNNDKNKKITCGRRAVYLRKVGDDKVMANIKKKILEKYAKSTNFECCHQFIIDSIQYPHDKPLLKYSNCTKFQDESIIPLQSDFINILCTRYDGTNESRLIYEDMYAFSKKINITKTEPNNCRIKYNVLMIGMDSMSLPRVVRTMPRTIAFLKNDNWLGFRGYHKVADDTFPNIMAALTGKNMSDINRRCSGRIDDCKNLLIWNAFKDIGYVTAYGEDNIQLPDTLTKEFAFREPPTDHYMGPFFQKGEIKRHKSILCSGKASSGQQLLDYALDFANTYKRNSFFGLFWLNSFSHETTSHPQNADKVVENFLNQLTYTGVLMNTFVIFFSDHGIRFGVLRSKMEAYYDDRMPMNFMWIPLFFKGKHPSELQATVINQYRLLTPYDLYSTLLDIRQISLCSNYRDRAPDGCRNCHSVFNVVNSNRTCEDASIHPKYCSCHKLYPLPPQDTIGIKSAHLAVNHVKTRVLGIQTQQCWRCMSLSLQTIVRLHFYYDKDKISLFYVVAFIMSPGNVTYEATVLRKGEEQSLVGSISVISTYRGLGNCALKREDRLFCVCIKSKSC